MRKMFLLVPLLASLAFAADPCRVPIYNRGIPPQSFIDEVVKTTKAAPDVVVAVNSNNDIYSLVKPKLAPNGWRSLAHRRAAMATVMITLGAYESSYDFTEGVDVSNPSSLVNKCSEEAGAFQTSANSMSFSSTLSDFFNDNCKDFRANQANACMAWVACTKSPSKKSFQIEFTERLLRYTTRHHGPLIRKSDVYNHLSVACMKDLEKQF
jgi:hypothetical protein